MSRVIETDIVGAVKAFTYVKNCHYLKITDDQGRSTTLLESGLIRYWCVDCSHLHYSPENRSALCPACGGTRLQQQWMRPQLSLIPEDESDLVLPPKGEPQ
jgi:RNA polymerase subunit RPABC4/transcription elongation factor Spt4